MSLITRIGCSFRIRWGRNGRQISAFEGLLDAAPKTFQIVLVSHLLINHMNLNYSTCISRELLLVFMKSRRQPINDGMKNDEMSC